MEVFPSSYSRISENRVENKYIVKLIEKPTKHKIGIAWSYSSISINKLVQILTGNKGHSYNIGMWNCRRGLLNKENNASNKITDVKLLLQKHDLHLLCLVEADLHGVSSRVNRSSPLSTQDINSKLKIENYSIFLPHTWQLHGQARILLVIKEGVQVKMGPLSKSDTDLPTISCEIGLCRERKPMLLCIV